MKEKKRVKIESIERLLYFLGKKRHQKLQVVIKAVSRSGMTRKMKFYYNDWDITVHIANILGWKLDKNDCLIVKGCGMDMVFHTIYCLNGAMLGHTKAYKNKKELEQGRYDKYFDSNKYHLL